MATTADFSVGDAVRVTATHAKYGWGHVNPGDIGVVIQINNIFVRVDFPHQHEWMADPNEIEIIEMTGEELGEMMEELGVMFEVNLPPKKLKPKSPKKPDTRHVI